MASVLKRCLIAACVASVAGLAVAAEEDKPAEKPARTQMCIQASRIDQSPAVDNRTIVLKMKDGSYKRMDLVNSCSDLLFGHGFSFETSIDELCTSTPLHINEIAGQTCMIKQIVDISKDEAKALLSKDHGKTKPAKEDKKG